MTASSLIAALSANAAARGALVGQLTPDTPPVISTPDGQLVHPMAGLTNNLYIDRALGVPWVHEVGDWLDRNGIANGPAPTYSLSGPGAAVDISRTPGDLLVQGVNSVSKVVMDHVDITAQCFGIAAGSGGSFHLPTQSGWRVIIPNDGGRLLEITTNAAGSWRMDPLSLPSVVIPTPVSYYRAPDLLRIEPTSVADMLRPGVSTPGLSSGKPIFGGPHTFENYGGVPFSNAYNSGVFDPVCCNGRVARCDYPLAPQQELYVAYLLGIGEHVYDAVTDLGVKLSGMTGDGGLLNMGEHINVYYNTRNPRNGTAIALRDQFYSPVEATVGQGAGNEQNSDYSHGFLRSPGVTLIEHGAIPNTFKPDGTPNQDGHKLTWINGVLVEDRLIAWFKTPGMLWRWLSMQIYHGGTKSYAKACNYFIGPYMASTQHIGVDPAFLPLLTATFDEFVAMRRA